MRSIVCVNCSIPTIEDELDYYSESSLLDYDVVVFDPQLPWEERIKFSGGGSCIAIEGTNRFTKASSHWVREFNGALASGKTIFVVLNTRKTDDAATGTTSSKGVRNYTTTKIDNYDIIPGAVSVRNARGRRIEVKDHSFKGLYEVIRDIVEYRVVFENSSSMRTAFATKDGTAVGGVVRFQQYPGRLVLLPYFDFEDDKFIDSSDEDGEGWTREGLKVSHALVGQLIAIDGMLRSSVEQIPPPDWVNTFKRAKAFDEIESAISNIDSMIENLQQQKDEELERKFELDEYAHLLYGNGRSLERAIEKTLRLLGYAVETLRIGDLEIDHVILGASGFRMIGESEGKDSSAVDITKFRQLESNIGEDFEREEIEHPARGILFGNGFRLVAPASRAEQFTQKCLVNAKRLGTTLVRTADLYAVAVHLLDHPQDDAFRAACRAAIEETVGGIVAFPDA